MSQENALKDRARDSHDRLDVPVTVSGKLKLLRVMDCSDLQVQIRPRRVMSAERRAGNTDPKAYVVCRMGNGV